jgi:peptide-methionine (S)-S-oxide reductase
MVWRNLAILNQRRLVKMLLALAKMNINLPIDIPATKVKGTQKIVLAGGCFWGIEAVFEDLKGVSSVVSGYSGGAQLG